MTHNQNHRFPGPRPYNQTESDYRLFKERENDTQLFLYLFEHHNPIIIYGSQGVGKTSFIHAGIMPALKQQHYFPCVIRLNDPLIPPISTIIKTIESSLQQSNLNYKLQSTTCFKTFINTLSIQTDTSDPIELVLIFDACEEFIANYSLNDQNAFIYHMNALFASPDTPELSNKDKLVKIVFSVQTEFLGHMIDVANQFSNLNYRYYQLNALTRNQIKSFLSQMVAIQKDHSYFIPFNIDSDTQDLIIDFCESYNGNQLKLLQIICFYLEQTNLINCNINGNVSSIQWTQLNDLISDWYAEIISQSGHFWETIRLKALCENGLFAQDGTRLLCCEKDICDRYDVPPHQLKQCVNKGLFQCVYQGNHRLYEFTHDQIAISIIQKNKTIRKKRMKWISLTCLMIVCLFFLVWIIPNKGTYNKEINNPPSFQKQTTKQTDQTDLSSYFKQAYQLGENGEYEQAIDIYQKILCLHPNDAVVHHNMAVNLDRIGRYEEATHHYRQAIQINSDDSDMYKNLGLSLIAQSQFEEAVQVLDEAIQLMPDHADYYKHKAFALSEMGLPDQAVPIYEKAIQLNPNDPDTYKKLGFAFFDQKKYEDAIGAYQQSIRLNPDDPFTLDSLGFAYFVKGDIPNAMTFCEKAIHLDPENPVIRMNFSELCLEAGDYEKALKHAQYVLGQNDIEPPYQQAMRLISAFAHIFMNNRDDAFQVVNEFLTQLTNQEISSISEWSYDSCKAYIKSNKDLNDTDKSMMLEWIEYAESPASFDFEAYQGIKTN